MSDAHNEHESIIRTPKQLVVAVAGFFLVIVIGIILLVSFVTNTHNEGAGTNSQDAAAVNARIAPVAADGFVLRDANAPRVLQSGEAVFKAVCINCHGTGMVGVPKVGDSAAWSARIAQGADTLIKHAIEGIRGMPPKGGNPDLDDVEVARAVVYMANQGGAKFKEPALPAASTVPAAAIAAPATAAAADTVAPAAVSTPAAAAPAVASVDTGKALYSHTCFACHGAGAAGAPKFADKAAWAPRLAQGIPTLYTHAIMGFTGKAGMMPAKGGSAASEADVKSAVDYMVAAAK